jgi:ribosome-associated protein
MIQEGILDGECMYSATRSSGPGGQHVNKVSTRVELRFDVIHSKILSSEEKQIVIEKLSNRITREGILLLVSQSERSQHENKEKVTARFYKMLNKALMPVRKRVPTRPTAASNVRRLETKKIRSEKKTLRKVNPEQF